jgi:hypothetical protein
MDDDANVVRLCEEGKTVLMKGQLESGSAEEVCFQSANRPFVLMLRICAYCYTKFSGRLIGYRV